MPKKTRNNKINNKRKTLKKIKLIESINVYPTPTFPTDLPIDDEDIEVRPGISKGFLRRISEPLHMTQIPVEEQTPEQRQKFKDMMEKYWYLFNTHQFTLEEHLQLLRDGKIPRHL
jgi:hypothetical protein